MGRDDVMVVKEFTFDAAHFLPGYAGACGSLHGHTYRLQVGIKGEVDPEFGMVIDFSTLKNDVFAAVICRLDHSFLNEPVNPNIYVPGFPMHMPSAENMVLWIRDRLLDRFSPKYLAFVRLWETPTSYAEWRAD